MKATGTNTAVISRVMAMMAPLISPSTSFTACRARVLLGHLGVHGLHHHDRVVDDDADGQHQREERDEVDR
jgi:hypothetical protein